MRNSAGFKGGESFDRVFRALGDPHRIRIIELLREKELSAGELLAALDVVQSTLSHHMKTLSDSGAVNALRRGKWTYYSLNEPVLAQACAFLEECAKGTRVRKTQPEGAKETPAGAQPAPVRGQNEKETAVQKAADVNKAQTVQEKSGKKKDKEKDKKGKKNKKNKK